MLENGGGSGKLGGELVLAGEGCSGVGDTSDVHGYGNDLRRGPGGSPVHETTGKRVRVSAVSMGSTVEGSVGRGKQQHGESVLDAYLGHGGALRRTRAAAAWLQRLRPPGGARERVE